MSDAKIRICAEGDSWINILWPFSALFCYEKTFFDVIQSKNKYHTRDFAYPGDTLQDIISNPRQYHASIGSGLYQFFVFSAAGNDLGGDALQRILKHKSAVPNGSPEEDYVNIPTKNYYLDRIAYGYNIVANEIKVWSSDNTKMLIHGYDYPTPVAGQPWLWRPFDAQGYDIVNDLALIKSILKYLINELYGMLAGVETSNSNVQLVDLRGTVGNRWHDELHPNEQGSKAVARKFLKVIDPPPVA